MEAYAPDRTTELEAETQHLQQQIAATANATAKEKAHLELLVHARL